MVDIKCTECGTVVLEGTKECPNCGCPLQNVNEMISIGCDDYDYSQFYTGILRAWHFSCSQPSEKESYDALNDFFLMCNLIFRIILRSALIPLLVYICGLVLAALLSTEVPMMALFTTPLFAIIAFVLFFIFAGKAIREYWVPLHRTFRRMNKRYWIAMDKAVKDNTINNI